MEPEFEAFAMKTYSVKKDEIKRDWYVVDAEGLILGRLATQVAARLRGKHKPTFTPHLDVGDFVVVVNADKIKLTGRKWDQKMYHHHSGYLGGLTSVNARVMMEKKPEELVMQAVRRMLPKTRLGRAQFKKLKVYAGPDHPHQAQLPTVWEV